MLCKYVGPCIPISSFFPQLRSSACFGPVIIQCNKDCHSCGIVNPWNLPSKSDLSCFKILTLINLAAWKTVLKSSEELSKLPVVAAQMLDEHCLSGLFLAEGQLKIIFLTFSSSKVFK